MNKLKKSTRNLLFSEDQPKLNLKDIEDHLEKINDDFFIINIEDEEWNELMVKLLPLKEFALKIEKYLKTSNQYKLEDEDSSKDKIIKKFEALKPD